MTDDKSGFPANGDDAELDRLLRDAATHLSDAVEWPSDEVVHAYLNNSCTPEQRAIVQFVLSRSPQFRAYIVDASASLEQIRSSQMQEAFDADRIAAQTFEDGFMSATPSVVDQLWEWINRRLSPRVAAPILAAVAVVLLFVGIQGPSDLSGRLVPFAMDTELEFADFTVTTTRSWDNTTVTSEPAASARQAAVRALQECVSYDIRTERFTLKPGQSQSMGDRDTRTMIVRIYREGAKSPLVVSTKIPVTDSGGNLSVRAWLMVPPSLKLWSVDLLKDSADLIWPAGEAAEGCLTITYNHDNRYYSAPAQVVRF